MYQKQQRKGWFDFSQFTPKKMLTLNDFQFINSNGDENISDIKFVRRRYGTKTTEIYGNVGNCENSSSWIQCSFVLRRIYSPLSNFTAERPAEVCFTAVSSLFVFLFFWFLLLNLKKNSYTYSSKLNYPLCMRLLPHNTVSQLKVIGITHTYKLGTDHRTII